MIAFSGPAWRRVGELDPNLPIFPVTDMRYILFITLTVFAGCSSGDVGKGAMTGLPSYACFVSRDTVLGGDEGVSWKGKAYLLKLLQFLCFYSEKHKIYACKPILVPLSPCENIRPAYRISGKYGKAAFCMLTKLG